MYKIDEFTAEMLEKDYEELKNIKAVAKKYGINRQVMSSIFRKLNVKYNFRSNVLPVNHEYFSEPFNNLQALYWIGFLTADGNIYKKELQMHLSETDLNHLIQFKTDLESEHKISRFLIKRKNNNWQETWGNGLQITSPQMIQDLAKFHVVPRKTFITKFPEEVKNSRYANIYCRGYIDGDGCWFVNYYKNKNWKPQLKLHIRGTEDFLRDFNEIIVKNVGLPKRCLDKNLTSSASIGALSYGGNNICGKIAKWIYSDVFIDENNSRFLGRKYDIAKVFINDNIKEPKF